MNTVAMPVFRSRIAPVFDSCLRVLLIQIDHDGEGEKSELSFNGFSLFERSNALKRAGVTTLICGGISKDLNLDRKCRYQFSFGDSGASGRGAFSLCF